MLKIIDNFFNNTDLLDELYTYFYYAGAWQFDYMPNNYIWKEKQATEVES